MSNGGNEAASSNAQRGFQVSLRLATLAVFNRIETRDMLADDFFRLVSLDRFSASVPRLNASFTTEQKNCVVGNAFHQKTK